MKSLLQKSPVSLSQGRRVSQLFENGKNFLICLLFLPIFVNLHDRQQLFKTFLDHLIFLVEKGSCKPDFQILRLSFNFLPPSHNFVVLLLLFLEDLASLAKMSKQLLKLWLLGIEFPIYFHDLNQNFELSHFVELGVGAGQENVPHKFILLWHL